MKAIMLTEYGSTEHLRYVDANVPEIGPNQLLIRVAATSVNYADIKARSGKKGNAPLPLLLGLEAAGVVERTGVGVTTFRRGQRVLCFPHGGSYAEYVVADEALTYALPDGVDLETAGAAGIVSFLAHMLLADVAGIAPGEAVVVHSAAGGVGTTAIQVAKALGASLVIGTVGDERKRAAALEAGADHVFLYNAFPENVTALTGGRGANVVLDSVGGAVTERSIGCLAPFGRLVAFGNSSGSYAPLFTGDLHASCRSVLGYSLGTARRERPDTLRGTAEAVFRLMESGRLRIRVGERFPLREAAAAHRLVESRRSTGKVLLIVE